MKGYRISLKLADQSDVWSQNSLELQLRKAFGSCEFPLAIRNQLDKNSALPPSLRGKGFAMSKTRIWNCVKNCEDIEDDVRSRRTQFKNGLHFKQINKIILGTRRNTIISDRLLTIPTFGSMQAFPSKVLHVPYVTLSLRLNCWIVIRYLDLCTLNDQHFISLVSVKMSKSGQPGGVGEVYGNGWWIDDDLKL